MYRGGEIDQGVASAWEEPEALRATACPVPVTYPGESPPDERYTQVNGLWVPAGSVRTDEDVTRGADHHPRGHAFRLDALTRARSQARRRSGRTLSAWSAADMWGLPWFCDDADTCMIGDTTPRAARDPDDCTVRRRTPSLQSIPDMQIDPLCPDLRVTPPVLTLIHCLQSVWRGDHRWFPVQGTGLTDRGLLAVQTVDAFCALFNLSPTVLPDACRDQFSARTLKRIVAVADQGTDSPMETVMRLKVRRILHGLATRGALPSLPELVAQLVVHADGSVSDPVHGGTPGTARIVARLDLGIREYRLGLQYDGSGHLAKSQRDRDSRITAELGNLGWYPLRLTYGHLTDDDLLWKTVTDALKLCLSRL